MKPRFVLPLAAAAISLAASSCTPWVEPNPPMPPNGDVAARNNADDPAEQARIKAKRDEMKKKAEREARRGDDDSLDGQTAGPSGDSGGSVEKKLDTDPEPQPKTPARSLPTAIKIPGKPGMVFSPWTNKMVDVADIPSGKTVGDPTSPGKRFLVP